MCVGTAASDAAAARIYAPTCVCVLYVYRTVWTPAGVRPWLTQHHIVVVVGAHSSSVGAFALYTALQHRDRHTTALHCTWKCSTSLQTPHPKAAPLAAHDETAQWRVRVGSNAAVTTIEPHPMWLLPKRVERSRL